MPTTSLHVNDSGVKFLFTVQNNAVPIDLTSVQNVDLFFQKPDKTVFSRVCNVTNPTGGVVQYVTTSNDLDQPGKWRLQLVVRFADDNIKHSNVAVITVTNNISPR